MADYQTETIKVSRQLTPENRDMLLDWVRLAHYAENAALKSCSKGTTGNNCCPLTPDGVLLASDSHE